MRIIELRAENVKRLKAIDIRPDGDVVVIAGRNAQGKSSVLDAIWMALAGAAGAKETTRPIRDGEKTAQVELNLGDLVVTRKWTQAGSTLIVASADGAHFPSPQKVLDELIGRLTFDPLAFAEAAQKDQLATLLSVVALPFDPAQLAMRRQGLYDQRTEINREVKRLEGAISELPDYPEDTSDDEVDVADLSRRYEEAMKASSRRQALVSEMQSLQERCHELRQELEAKEAQVRELAERIEDPVDVEPLFAELSAVEQTNSAVRAKREVARLVAEREARRDEAESLSSRLTEIDREKADALAKAAMPLEGLSFDDEGVLYKGIPIAQISDSERLRVSIAIAMALNPKIRVIRITDGSLLDSENMKLIEEMAAASDFQVWCEVVDESGMVGITIEDGAIVDAD